MRLVRSRILVGMLIGVSAVMSIGGASRIGWRPMFAAESLKIYGALTCNGQTLENRCGNTSTDCSAPNRNNYCDSTTVGTSCNDGLYKGTGSAFGCHKTGGNILCYGVEGAEQRCDATTICMCKKSLTGKYSCVEESMNWRVVESAKESTTNCTPE